MRATGQFAALTIAAIVAAAAPAPALAEGTGIVADANRLPWPRFQGRIAYTAVPSWRSDFGSAEASGLKVGGASLMGDVYFGASPRGFRATSGVLVGARHGLWGSTLPAAVSPHRLGVERRFPGATALGAPVDTASESATLPYVGIGYSSMPSRAGWSFSADFGLMSLAPGNAVRLGRVFSGSQSLDDVVRDMRFAPVIQLGVSYSF